MESKIKELLTIAKDYKKLYDSMKKFIRVKEYKK